MKTTYKVKCLSVGAKGNRIFTHGEEVKPEYWNEETFEKLIIGGYIEEVKEADPPNDKIDPPNQEPEKENVHVVIVDTPPIVKDVTEHKTAKDFTVDELKSILDLNGVKYTDQMSREDLVKLYKKLESK